MPLLVDDEHRQLMDTADRALADTYNPARLRDLLEQPGAWDQAYWLQCRDLGWTAAAVSEADGGLGLGPLALALLVQVSGRYAAGATFLSTNFGVSEALRLYAEPASRQALATLASGDAIGAVHLNLQAVSNELVLGGDQVTGTIGPVASGLAARWLVTVCERSTDGSAVLVLVDLEQRTARNPTPTFDNSRVYADLVLEGAPAVVLVETDAQASALDLLARMAVIGAFEQIGVAEACLARACSYAKTRQAFGQPIGKFQAVKHGIAEIYVALELARGSAFRAAVALQDDADDLVLHAGAARLNAIVASELAARTAIQVHGAVGVTWEHDLHLFYRRARSLALETGSVAAWQDIVADRVIAGCPLEAA